MLCISELYLPVCFLGRVLGALAVMEIMRIDWKTSSGGWFCKASNLIPSTGVVDEQ